MASRRLARADLGGMGNDHRGRVMSGTGAVRPSIARKGGPAIAISA
jgi:hypothetical protein